MKIKLKDIMKDKIKVIILLLSVLLLISLFIIFNLQNSKLALWREYASTKQRLTQENEGLVTKLNSISEENRRLLDRLGYIQSELKRVSSEKDEIQHNYELVNKDKEELLERLRSYAQLEEELESSRNENKTLEEKIDTLKKHKLILESDVNKLRQENERFKRNIEEAKDILKQKDSDEISQTGAWSIDLPPIVVSPQATLDKGLAYSLKGEIVNVNRQYNFVIIDLGYDMGVGEGMVFEVRRQDKFVGKVEVISVREKIAACNTIQAYIPFKIGDTVRY